MSWLLCSLRDIANNSHLSPLIIAGAAILMHIQKIVPGEAAGEKEVHKKTRQVDGTEE